MINVNPTMIDDNVDPNIVSILISADLTTNLHTWTTWGLPESWHRHRHFCQPELRKFPILKLMPTRIGISFGISIGIGNRKGNFVGVCIGVGINIGNREIFLASALASETEGNFASALVLAWETEREILSAWHWRRHQY